MIAIVQFTCPDRAAAEAIARTLLEEHLIACANIIGPCRSIYRWEGVIEEADEVVMQLKTMSTYAPAAMARIAALHPYALPAIEHWPAETAPELAEWITASTEAVK
ncbi:divalent-cation tolerance protein CutA [Sphingomonas sp. CL5.1]|uniref:divalent-cation tolerance protein CutA n=1 Tax=Sphingomonas sp. CL5.1 TaxID=2653203 RepID=UPI001581A0CE|nr:divalent-cation tolerance protein CutA [Sphingomonas sp. CL5.1]QKS00050.1 divalent-cation tolerance protein CutA [Sphingomonas sp. CL5.1]